MTYSTSYSREKYTSIESSLETLSNLAEGKSLALSFSSTEEASRMKWLFHDYFHLMGTTSTFKVRQIESYLFIGRKETSLSTIVFAKKRSISAEFDFIMESLLSSSTPRVYISQLVMNKELSFASLSIILAEYSRIMQE